MNPEDFDIMFQIWKQTRDLGRRSLRPLSPLPFISPTIPPAGLHTQNVTSDPIDKPLVQMA